MNEDPPSQYATGSAGESKDQKKEKVVVVVDDAHPFDLDAYIASYSGVSYQDNATGKDIIADT